MWAFLSEGPRKNKARSFYYQLPFWGEGGLRVHLLPKGKEVNEIVMMHHSTYHHQHKRLWLHQKGNLRNYYKKVFALLFASSQLQI
jgi:hypothetical protein